MSVHNKIFSDFDEIPVCLVFVSVFFFFFCFFFISFKCFRLITVIIFGKYIHVEVVQCKVVKHVHKVLLNTEFSQMLPHLTISAQCA